MRGVWYKACGLWSLLGPFRTLGQSLSEDGEMKPRGRLVSPEDTLGLWWPWAARGHRVMAGHRPADKAASARGLGAQPQGFNSVTCSRQPLPQGKQAY